MKLGEFCVSSYNLDDTNLIVFHSLFVLPSIDLHTSKLLLLKQQLRPLIIRLEAVVDHTLERMWAQLPLGAGYFFSSLSHSFSLVRP